jgi:hypothetical protein
MGCGGFSASGFDLFRLHISMCGNNKTVIATAHQAGPIFCFTPFLFLILCLFLYSTLSFMIILFHFDDCPSKGLAVC